MKLPSAAAENEKSAANISSPSLTISEREVDFSEYMWMGEELEEFDRKCLQDLYEEDFIEQSFDELFREEEQFVEELEKYLNELSVDESRQLIEQLNIAPSPAAPASAAAAADTAAAAGPATALAEEDGNGVAESQLPYIVQYEVPVQVDLNPYAPVFVPYNLMRSRLLSAPDVTGSVSEE